VAAKAKVLERGRDCPLSLSYYTVPNLTPPEVVNVAAESGCQHVGLRLLGGQPGDNEMPLLIDANLRRLTRLLMVDTGITALDANTARIVPETDIQAFLPFLDVAAELGARHVLTTADDPEGGRLVDNLIALGDAATERALTIDLEFVPWLSICNVLNAADLIRRCEHPAIGIAVDALHFSRSGSEVGDLRDLPSSWFRYVQVCDAPYLLSPPGRDELIHEAIKERLLPGEGIIDLVGLLRALPPSLPLAIEIPQASLAATMGDLERVTRAVKATRALLNEIGVT